jgi:hypothetical protein
MSPYVLYYSYATDMRRGVSASASVAEIRRAPLTPGMKSHDTNFSARRRRAHKLSRFFGLGYDDLFNVMVYENASTGGQSSLLVPPVPPLPSIKLISLDA